MTGTGSTRRVRGSAAHRAYSVTVFVVLAALDNVAIALPPPLLSPISRDLATSEAGVATAVSLNLLLTAVAALGWGYLGDRADRKRVLMLGTLLWSAGMGATAVTTGYPAFLAAQALAGIGLGAVASVGFSVVSDLISPRRRGLVMGLWGLSQGAGTLVGVALAGLVGSADWRAPFRVLALAGLLATVAYLFTINVPRGQREPALQALYEAGEVYQYDPAGDLPQLFTRRTNLWLVAQGFTAQIAYGSLVWVPRLFQAKAEELGYPEPTAIEIGSMFTILAYSGAVLSLIGGLVGDRRQRRTLRGRAQVAAIGCSWRYRCSSACSSCRAAGSVAGDRDQEIALAVPAERGHRTGHGRHLPAGTVGDRAAVGPGAEHLRTVGGGQSAGAPGHRVQPRQPRQRARAGGRRLAGGADVRGRGAGAAVSGQLRGGAGHLPVVLPADRGHVLAGFS